MTEAHKKFLQDMRGFSNQLLKRALKSPIHEVRRMAYGILVNRGLRG